MDLANTDFHFLFLRVILFLLFSLVVFNLAYLKNISSVDQVDVFRFLIGFVFYKVLKEMYCPMAIFYFTLYLMKIAA